MEDDGWDNFWMIEVGQPSSSMRTSGINSVIVVRNVFFITFVLVVSSGISTFDAGMAREFACLFGLKEHTRIVCSRNT